MNLPDFLSSTAASHLAASLLHTIWQGALVTALAAGLLACLPRRTPAQAHAIHAAALGLILAFFPINGALALQWPAPFRAVSAAFEERGSDPVPASRGLVPEGGGSTAVASIPPAAWLVGFYFAGVSLMMARLSLAWGQSRRLRRRARRVEDGKLRREFARAAARLGLRRAPLLSWSGDVMGPAVVGLLQPMVLLPPALVTALTDAQLRALLLHELAHVFRRDAWILALQRCAETILFFNPFVWLLSRQIEREREACCDDMVLRHGSCREEYAEALLVVADGDGRGAAPALSARGSRPSVLRQRIQRILGIRESGSLPTGSGSWLGIFLAVVGAGVVWNLPAPEIQAADKAGNETKKEVERLGQRVADLEKGEAAARDIALAKQQVEANRALARERGKKDFTTYTKEQLAEIEELYQVANKSWRSPEAKASLEKLVAKYGKANRTGCAVLYLGQYSEGEDRLKYLKQAVEQFSDCFYYNGCQVAGYGRYLLAAVHLQRGEKVAAKAVIRELREKYPKTTSHRGQLMVKMIEELEKQL